ncbi:MULTISPECIES: hypothetical protein [Paraburkholderia]|uniref:hypothetical protein n=1 Tax=Paraburkholderia TaxID=1822464 RepID=UPI0022557739|nr:MULTISPECIES: hypothetical protein [Paraburkholderia]MCX4175642.1 hypothetical protein [Paraburkholderia madseniana]MDQ6463637.1 hypothetical protein [Paraburkholderia madseniana]
MLRPSQFRPLIAVVAHGCLALTVLLGTSVEAQCINQQTPSCGVYKQCFAKYCPCSGDKDEYFESYGLKYCQRFLNNTNLTAEGKRWRDKTLVCLQEAIVPKLDISANPSCNCEEMKGYAFKVHVTCYTQPGSSICALPIADLNEMRKTIDVADAFASEGWLQMKEVANICVDSAPDDGRRALWIGIRAVLSAR